MHIPAYYWVINTSNQDHADKYDGAVLTFPKNQPVLVTWQVAHTCFGLDDANKLNCLSRLGWMQPTSKPEAIEKAVKKLDQFKIVQAQFAPPEGF